MLFHHDDISDIRLTNKPSCFHAGVNAVERTPYANRIVALERSIWSFTETGGEHAVEQALGMTFDSLGEAYALGNMVSACNTGRAG
jgi:hypothetical protein